MSYILDALQRREAEQNPEAAAALVLKQHKASRARTTGALIGGALLINAAVLLWLFLPARSEPPTSNLAEAPAPASAASPEPVRAPTPMAAPPVTVVTPTAPQPMPARTPRPPRRVIIDALPRPAQDRFPGLAFSTHVYAEDPSLRAVVINGTRLTEGDAIDGTVIEQITETGVLVAFEDYLVEIPVIAQWQ